MFEGVECIAVAMGIFGDVTCSSTGNFHIWENMRSSPVIVLIAGVVLGVPAAAFVLRRILPKV